MRPTLKMYLDSIIKVILSLTNYSVQYKEKTDTKVSSVFICKSVVIYCLNQGNITNPISEASGI